MDDAPTGRRIGCVMSTITLQTGLSALIGVGACPEAQSDALAAASIGAGSDSRLEFQPNKWNQIEKKIVFKAKRCKCRICADCGYRYGQEVRRGLLLRVPKFKRAALLTLTIDRSGFASPAEAHRFITDDGLIRRLMRLLGIATWVWVLEFQQATGTGWPHWHVLVDLSTLPDERIDLQHAWRLWRDMWGAGSVDLQVRKRFSDSRYAVFYITKYLVKFPEMGFPLWVKESSRIRFFQASRSLGAILGRRTSTSKTVGPKAPTVALAVPGGAGGGLLSDLHWCSAIDLS